MFGFEIDPSLEPTIDFYQGQVPGLERRTDLPGGSCDQIEHGKPRGTSKFWGNSGGDKIAIESICFFM